MYYKASSQFFVNSYEGVAILIGSSAVVVNGPFQVGFVKDLSLQVISTLNFFVAVGALVASSSVAVMVTSVDSKKSVEDAGVKVKVLPEI